MAGSAANFTIAPFHSLGASPLKYPQRDEELKVEINIECSGEEESLEITSSSFNRMSLNNLNKNMDMECLGGGLKDGCSLNEGVTCDTEVVEEHQKDDSNDERVSWGTKADFLLSVIGYAVDLANLWRFPYLCYKNGGGVFLIPYFIMLLFGGIPLFYMELALGQYQREGPISVWKICPLLKGVGYSACIVAFYVAFYYNVIICWALYYLINSFRTQLPWGSCDFMWNTAHCSVGGNATGSNMTGGALISPAEEYYKRRVLMLDKSSGLENMGAVQWELTLCLFGIFTLLYFSLWKGIKMSGKVVWVTATLPYIMLFILLLRGVTLPGAATGIRYYLRPNLYKLLEPGVWIDAAVQIFYSLGVGFGVLIAFSSYNNFHNNCYTDALCTSSVNCATSFLSGFVVFSILGYMSEKNNVPIENVATEGSGLVFVVYPEAISTLPYPNVWAVVFFLMLLTLGLDSSMGGLESVITGISDDFKTTLRKHRELFTLLIVGIAFTVGLCNTTYGGAYLVNLFDSYAAQTSILCTVVFEAVGVFWLYGTKQFAEDINEMMGFTPGIGWRFVWKFISPVFLFAVLLFSVINYRTPAYEDYKYPIWAEVVGWSITLSSMLFIPFMALYAVIVAPGDTFFMKLAYAVTPEKDRVLIKSGDIKRYQLQHYVEF